MLKCIMCASFIPIGWVVFPKSYVLGEEVVACPYNKAWHGGKIIRVAEVGKLQGNNGFTHKINVLYYSVAVKQKTMSEYSSCHFHPKVVLHRLEESG